MTSASSDVVKLDPHDAVRAAGLLSLARIPLGVAFAIAARKPKVGMVVLGLAGLTDVLDGWIARRTHTATATGAVIDASADKAFLLSVLVALVRLHRLTLGDLALLSVRELAELPLVVRYVRERSHVHDAPAANALGKLTTTLQFAALGAALLRLRPRPFVAMAGAVGALSAFVYWRRALQDG